MCEVSDKIKFCTCKAVDPTKLKNYWVFHRFHNDRFEYIIGIWNMNFIADEQMMRHNEETLLKRINELDAFDIDLHPKTKDRLEIVLTCDEHFLGDWHVGFEYKNKKWVKCGYDPLEWKWKHTNEAFGKLKKAL